MAHRPSPPSATVLSALRCAAAGPTPCGAQRERPLPGPCRHAGVQRRARCLGPGRASIPYPTLPYPTPPNTQAVGPPRTRDRLRVARVAQQHDLARAPGRRQELARAYRGARRRLQQRAQAAALHRVRKRCLRALQDTLHTRAARLSRGARRSGCTPGRSPALRAHAKTGTRRIASRSCAWTGCFWRHTGAVSAVLSYHIHHAERSSFCRHPTRMARAAAGRARARRRARPAARGRAPAAAPPPAARSPSRARDAPAARRSPSCRAPAAASTSRPSPEAPGPPRRKVRVRPNPNLSYDQRHLARRAASDQQTLGSSLHHCRRYSWFCISFGTRSWPSRDDRCHHLLSLFASSDSR